MSNERSPRGVCSTTIGTSGILSFRYSATLRLRQMYQMRNPTVALTWLNRLGGATMTDRIERELVLPASPGDVWRALTDPDWLSQWLADEVTLELRPGGDARFR